jgi:glycosyltransferase involved in cell wall biosynthesis
VIHNLPPGGARRRLSSQLEFIAGEIIEICLQTATPITDRPVVVPLKQLAPTRPRSLRPPFRYLDLAALELAWRRAARTVRRLNVDVLYLNPCRYLQAPPVLFDGAPPALYFCDEPRRVDAEPEVRATRNRLTNPFYGPMYARERQLDRATTARVTRIATNSRYTASEIERVYHRQATVLTMGVPSALLQPLNVAAAGRFLLSVGALIPTKGHDLALRAAAASAARPPVRIVAPRPAPPEQARLQALAYDLGIDATIQVGISDAELQALYTTATATLYLAEREPLGLVSLEAQACGCPVIVAAEGGLPETIVDGVTGWQTPRDPAAVAAFVDRLTDRAVRDTMGAAARTRAQSWSWKASGAEVESLLAEVVGAG